MGIFDKAKDLVEDHEKEISEGLEKAGELAKDKIGHEAQVDKAVDAAQDLLEKQTKD